MIVRKVGKLFVVEGIFPVVEGWKIVNEPYQRVFRTRKDAEWNAKRLMEINRKAVVDLNERQQARLECCQVYLQERDKRYESQRRQMTFAF